ncbi:MAG: LysM peptidoglycan-binding domain-containing protein [Elusimicrobia bacterium]|nr:LysM peptidoglycan-binding domain-containing protein [Elusimicrobiota bacterium]
MRGLILSLFLACPSAGAGGGGAAEVVFQNVVVRQGDTLWGIANTYLKDPSKWDQILRYNRLPSSDPTVALPGMVLRVPIQLIKENLRAAHLIYMVNRVLFRRKETADWKGAKEEMELFRGDSVRTLDASKAKVKFLNADLLSLDPNSLAIIKPMHEDYDVELKTGGLFVGRSKVVTVSARITPKTQDTQYSARVRQDLSTLVEVYTGLAAVEGQGKSVDVKAGMASEVKLGLAPTAPTKIADLPEFEARAADFNGETVAGQSRLKVASGAELPTGAAADDVNNAADANNLKAEVSGLSIGLPISGYRLQASRARQFDKVIFDKVFEADSRIDLAYENIPSGIYWFRIALIDLLGTEQAFSSPRLYSVGLGRQLKALKTDLKSSLLVSKPSGDEDVVNDMYRIVGRVTSDNLSVSVNGKPGRQDENGNFSVEIKLNDGPNIISISVRDSSGNTETITRKVTFHGRYGGL